MILSAPAVLAGDGLLHPGAVVVEDGLIVDVLPRRPSPSRGHIALDDGLLTPGLIDLQVNGAFGVDLATAADADWLHVAHRLCETGVTSFLPTFITAPIDDLVDLVRLSEAAGHRLSSVTAAQVPGAHVEGPFLSPTWPGVHDPLLMTDPDRTSVERLLQAAGGMALLTIAPERPGAIDAIQRFVHAGVRVSLGHTDAVAADVTAAADAGATCITHVFNAQRPLGHREPGVPGQALGDSRFTIGLIADLHHVAAQICAVVMRAAPGRVALVTDATAAAGMPPGRYQLADVPVHVPAEGEPPRRGDGRLAGSALTLDAAIRNLARIGVDISRAVDAASRVPADVLGRPDLGRIASGAIADLVWWSADLRPQRTWVRGVEVGLEPEPRPR